MKNNFKLIFNNLLFLFVFFYLESNSQDIIINVDSTKTFVKVLDVGIETITYKKIENLDGPTYTSLRSEIVAIKYKNGYEDIFQQEIYRKFENLIEDKQYLDVKDTIAIVATGDPNKNFIIIDFIKLSIESENKKNRFIVDFSQYKSEKYNNIDGKLQFIFIDEKSDFKIKSYYQGNGKFITTFRFYSAGSKIRYERLMEDNLRTIRFSNGISIMVIELNEMQQKAIKHLFINSYPFGIRELIK